MPSVPVAAPAAMGLCRLHLSTARRLAGKSRSSCNLTQVCSVNDACYKQHSPYSEHPHRASLTGLCSTPDTVTALLFLSIYEKTMSQGLCTCFPSSWDALPTEEHLLHVPTHMSPHWKGHPWPPSIKLQAVASTSLLLLTLLCFSPHSRLLPGCFFCINCPLP